MVKLCGFLLAVGFIFAAVFIVDSHVVVGQTSDARVIGRPPAGQIYHGVYPGKRDGEEDDVTPGSLRTYRGKVLRRTAWVYFSHEWSRGRQFPGRTARWIRARGAVPYIRLMLRSSEEQDIREPVYTLARIAGGDFDGDIRAWARSAKTFNYPLLVEYGTEVNGRWFPWNAQWNGRARKIGYGSAARYDGPERFRDAYRRIIRLMRQEGADNIRWVFHVNDQDIPHRSWNRMRRYYPGDAWIDWLAVSVYGPQTPMDDETNDFRPLMDGAYRRVKKISSTKPIILAEFGASAGNPRMSQHIWANKALKDLTNRRWPRLIGFSWWNEGWSNDGNPAHDTNMRVQDNPLLGQVFRSRLRFNQRVRGWPAFVNR